MMSLARFAAICVGLTVLYVVGCELAVQTAKIGAK